MSNLTKMAVVLLALLSIAVAPSAPTAVPAYLQIEPYPPKDLATRDASMEDLAKFAWQEFFALNWKASIDSRHPPSAANQRGTPDLNWNPRQPVPQYPNPLVWQTYAQTTELRPNGPLTIAWEDLGIPHYSYAILPVAGSGQNNLWNNLDEDSEIGSCNIYGQYSRQKNTKTLSRDLVLFQVKVNRDEYEYIRKNYGPDQHQVNGLLSLVQAKVAKNITIGPDYAYYPRATTTCVCPAESAICLPCGLRPEPETGLAGVEGAIEVKTAWRRLLPAEDSSRFYTTTALYYNNNSANDLAYYNDVFALVSMHIIHKTTRFPDFVFATFEQVDVERSDANYIVLDQNGNQVGTPIPVQRQTGQNNRQQLHPVPPALEEVNRKVRAQIAALNPESVWQYYRLTGVQGASRNCAVSLPQGNPVSTNNCIHYQDAAQCLALDPNYYMANFMVESDVLLNNFSGPGFGNDIFGNGSCANTVYARTPVNNGGCKGCHGAAQTAFGTDFSFLLDFGNNKPSVQPATLNIGDLPPEPASVPLKRYLKMIKQ